MEDVFYGHLVHFMAIWYILWPFDIFYGYLLDIFLCFGMFYQEKSGNPGSRHQFSSNISHFDIMIAPYRTVSLSGCLKL
jgi:hypothetical protein